MTRVFLIISSSEYDDKKHLSLLEGVIVDGNEIEKTLLDSSLGEYDKSISKHLVSPTLEQVRKSIDEILFQVNDIECFTLYFAGHGIAHFGTYYLCVKDTFVERLSTTALPVNHIFNVINDRQPLQTNIIIDACEAGGLSSDLASLIKPEVFGNANSPSVSLFGSCMRDEAAEENKNKGGVATQELLKYITGNICIDTRWPFLDIVQIGRNVSVAVEEAGYSQTPVVWGLNLTGFSTFSKNPNFKSEENSAPDTINIHTLLSTDFDLIQDEKEQIWLHYIEIKNKSVTPEFLNFLINLVRELKSKGMDPAKIGAFLLATAENFATRVADNKDVFSEIEVMSAFGAAFLPILEEENAQQPFLVLLERIEMSANRALETLYTDLKTECNALMSSTSGLNDLFFLPIRITKILGWMGLVEIIQNHIGIDKKIHNQRSANILDELEKSYSCSFACVSDIQAPYLMVFLQMQEVSKLNEKFLLPLRCYINDFFYIKGNILHADVTGKDILNYLLRKSCNDYSGIEDLIAKPSELLSVLFDGVITSDMKDEVDPYMIKLDHLPLNIFLAEDVTTFSEERIENGTNITIQIGSEVGNGIFTIEDFRNNFINECEARIETLRENHKPETIIAMVLSSFSMPNRVAWPIQEIIAP